MSRHTQRFFLTTNTCFLLTQMDTLQNNVFFIKKNIFFVDQSPSLRLLTAGVPAANPLGRGRRDRQERPGRSHRADRRGTTTGDARPLVDRRAPHAVVAARRSGPAGSAPGRTRGAAGAAGAGLGGGSDGGARGAAEAGRGGTADPCAGRPGRRRASARRPGFRARRRRPRLGPHPGWARRPAWALRRGCPRPRRCRRRRWREHLKRRPR